VHGVAPFGYHLVNFALHAAVCVVLALVLARITGDATLALLAAFLFAAHPVHTEAVASVVGRAELLAALLGLLAWWIVLARRSVPARAVAALVLVAAALAKENAITIVAVAIAAHPIYPRRLHPGGHGGLPPAAAAGPGRRGSARAGRGRRAPGPHRRDARCRAAAAAHRQPPRDGAGGIAAVHRPRDRRDVRPAPRLAGPPLRGLLVPPVRARHLARRPARRRGPRRASGRRRALRVGLVPGAARLFRDRLLGAHVLHRLQRRPPDRD